MFLVPRIEQVEPGDRGSRRRRVRPLGCIRFDTAVTLAIRSPWHSIHSPRRAAGICLPAFGFGLVHGLGFATALAVLAGFNSGVELAQLGVVAVLLPALLWLRNSPFYAARLVPAASMAMMLAGAAWLAARA